MSLIRSLSHPLYWPFVWGIHWSLVKSPHKGQWCGALVFSLICTRINGWVNNRETGDLGRHHTHYDVTVMYTIDPHYREAVSLVASPQRGSVMGRLDAFMVVSLNTYLNQAIPTSEIRVQFFMKHGCNGYSVFSSLTLVEIIVEQDMHPPK